MFAVSCTDHVNTKPADDERARIAALEKRVAGLEAVVMAGRRPAAARSSILHIEAISIIGLPSLGASSPWAVVEFSDFQCPYCRKYFVQTFPALRQRFVDTGKIRYFFHHFPIASLHPEAIKGAEASTCAAAQQRFWDFQQRLFGKPFDMSRSSHLRYARDLGLDLSEFERCLDGAAPLKVRQQIANASRLGLTGTPAFLIGELDGAGRLKVRRHLQGAQSIDSFEVALKELFEMRDVPSSDPASPHSAGAKSPQAPRR